MKTQFTPGPWEVISTDKEAYDGAHVADMSNNLLVIAEAEIGCSVADAHLIAAAPCLLEACKLLMQHADVYSAAYQAAEIAIAKAEGRAE